MNKLAKLIAAAHASVLLSGIAAGGAVAQSAAEVKAYMEAVRTGTPDAIASFMRHYPKSTLPGSELGDRIASSLGSTKAPMAAAEQAPASRQRNTHFAQRGGLY